MKQVTTGEEGRKEGRCGMSDRKGISITIKSHKKENYSLSCLFLIDSLVDGCAQEERERQIDG